MNNPFPYLHCHYHTLFHVHMTLSWIYLVTCILKLGSTKAESGTKTCVRLIWRLFILRSWSEETETEGMPTRFCYIGLATTTTQCCWVLWELFIWCVKGRHIDHSASSPVVQEQFNNSKSLAIPDCTCINAQRYWYSKASEIPGTGVRRGGTPSSSGSSRKRWGWEGLKRPIIHIWFTVQLIFLSSFC